MFVDLFFQRDYAAEGVDIGEALSHTTIKWQKDEDSGFHNLLVGSSSRICAIHDETFDVLLGQPVFRPTGDLFKVLDGKYYFRHRKDSIVKRMGKKFNTALVEEKASAANLSCAVVKSGPTDHSAVVMFVAGRQNSEELQARLTVLKNSLPVDHWPDKVEFIESLPVTAHGKVDKAAILDSLPTHRSNPIDAQTFEELWSYFTIGSVRPLPEHFKRKGFISCGGNSLNAVLFVNSLTKSGVDADQDTLIQLLKDVAFDKCLAHFRGVFEGAAVKAEEGSAPSRETPSTSTVLTTLASPLEAKATMALKGRIWPRPVHFPRLWNQEEPVIRHKWKIDLRKCVDSSPLAVVKNNRETDCLLIVGSHSGIVVVVDIAGEIVAKTQLPDRVEASACLSVDEGSFYIGCYDGKLYSVRITDGSVLWEFATGDMVKCTAVVHERNVFFGSYDKHLYAVNETGTLTWKREVGAVTVPVLVHGSSVIVGTLCGKVVILNSKDGHELHSFIVGPPVFANLLLAPFGRTNCLLTCAVDGTLHWRNVDEAFSEVHISNCSGTIFASPVLVNGRDLVVTSGSTVQYLRPPECLWTRSFDDRSVATPFVAGNRLIVVTSTGELFLLCLDSGSLLSSHKFPGEVFSSPVAVGDKIIVGCRDNHLHCLNVS